VTVVEAEPITDELELPVERRTGLRRGLPTLVCLAVMGGLLPLRSHWAVSLVLVCLSLTTPGIIALRAARVPATAILRYPLYVLAASVFVIMAAGLGADLLGPPLGNALPLHGVCTAITVLGVSAVLWLLSLRAPRSTIAPWRGVVGRPTLAFALALPALAAAGAMVLTSGHSATLARVVAVVTATALLACLVFAGRLSRAGVAMLLFACALAAEWAFSIRSQEIVGFDISTEIYVAQHTHAAGIWHIVNRNNAYSAMLSVTVLPSALDALTGMSPFIAFKVLFPVLAATLPLTAFFLAERVTSRRLAAGAAALIIAQSYFFQLMPQLARQEVGLLFFAALVVALLDEGMRTEVRLVLVSAFSLGLVLSHYSSAYIAIPVVVLALILQATLGRLRGLPTISSPLLCATIVLVGGASLWYGALTHSASNLTSFTSTLNRNGLDLLPSRKGSVINSYLVGNLVENVPAARFEQLAVQDYRTRAAYVRPLPQARQPRYELTNARVAAPRVRIAVLNTAAKFISTLVNELMLVAGVLGALAMSVRRRAGPTERTVGLLSLSTTLILAFLRFSGTAAAAYNQQRALLQSLILLTVTAAWMVGMIRARLRRPRLRLLQWPIRFGLAGAVSILFAYQLGAVAVAAGGPTSLNLAASGEDFERQYTTPAELTAATWATVKSDKQLLYADRYGQLRLFASTGRLALTDLTPRTIDGYSWVYGTHTNVDIGHARGEIGNFSSLYTWPETFLDRFFNVVYANGDSRVYHR
jgi:uncharacterized membrane protein